MANAAKNDELVGGGGERIDLDRRAGGRTAFIEPGSPWENGHIESFNARLHDEFLNGENDFTGGVTVQSADLIAASPTALGVGDVVVRGGSMTLQEPALARSATLSVAKDLPDGAVRLDFDGRNVVRALQIGHTMHRCGTWGGPESGAMFVDPVFSGPGVLELAARPLEMCAPDPEEPVGRRAKRRKSLKAHASRP